MTGLRLLLVTDAVGGVWTYSVELARGLRPLGIETVIAVIGPSPSDGQRHDVTDFELIDTGLPLDWIEADAAKLGRATDALADLARMECADIVQLNSAALLAGGKFDQPCVTVQHSCVASWWAAVRGAPLPSDFVWRRELTQVGLTRAAAVVAPSITFAAETSRLYGIEVVAVHNGRSTAAVTDIPQGQFAFTAGRLWDEGKNITTLDAAAGRLRVPFQAAGATAGPNGASVDLDHVEALGDLSTTRLTGLLSARPVYASAALYEPFGLSVLEAAQAGCGLVLSDIPTHREIWDGAAIFVSARDDAAFAAAIEDLINDPDERATLGQLARARAAHYIPDRMARAMADIYARVARPHFIPTAIAGVA